MNTSFLKHIFLVLTVIILASCDNDFNEVGANVVGDDNFLGEQETYAVTAFNLGYGAVDSKALPVAPLGIYNNTVFGKTKANFATQVQLAVESPIINLDLDPTITSVTLRIPYFSRRTSTDSNGKGIYVLDSVFGDKNLGKKIKLDIYESKYYMRDIDPILGTTQNFYTDQNSDFASSMSSAPLNNSTDATQNSEFYFDDTEKTFSTTDTENNTTTTNVAPEMQINLNSAVFAERFFSAAATGQLINNNIFKNYFRGLYFHVDESGTDAGQLAMLNFAAGTIVIKYKQKASTTNESIVDKELSLVLKGNSVSLPETVNSAEYSDALANANQTTGDDKLFVRGGGSGSMAVIEIFKNKAELDELRAKKWLVNDASLTFFVDNDKMNVGSAVESQRVYLYDLNNKRPLIDYSVDMTVSSTNTKRNKVIHGGIISDKDTENRGTRYKVRITNYLQTLLESSDSTSVRLGLVVTENINVVTNKKLRTPKVVQQIEDLRALTINEIPLMSVAHQFGTVLYGGGSNVPEDKRLKLTVYYTKPN